MPRKGTGSKTLAGRAEPRHVVIASGTASATPGTAVAVTLTGGTASGYDDLTDAELLALARRDFRVVSIETAGVPPAFQVTAASASAGTVSVSASVASVDFEVVVEG